MLVINVVYFRYDWSEAEGNMWILRFGSQGNKRPTGACSDNQRLSGLNLTGCILIFSDILRRRG